MKLLLADDDPSMLEAVGSALERPGVEVTRARSGAEFLQHVVDDGPFDLVITDISMPWMSGVQVSRSLRAAGVQVPILFMTALKQDKLDAQVAALGARTALLRKPFTVDALRASVDALLARP